MKLKNLLKENPDLVAIKDLAHNDRDAYSFGFHKNKAYVGSSGEIHFDIKKDLLNRGKMTRKEYENFPAQREEFKYSGRFWYGDKVISFWEYPKENQIKSIISKLEKAGGIKIWNNGWKIEVIDKGGKLYKPDDIEWEDCEVDGNIKLIPLEAYEGSQKQIGKEVSHLKSPLLKKKRKVPMGLGSKKKVKGQRKGEVPAAARHRIRKGLGDGVIRLKDLIKEIFILYEDQSGELVKIARTQNGLINPKGEAYAVPAIRHIDFLVKQPKFRSFKRRLELASGNEYAIIYEAIMNEAMSDGWVRISGNKSELGFMATKKHWRNTKD